MRKPGRRYQVYNGKALREALQRAKICLLLLPLLLGLLCGAWSIRHLSAGQLETLAGIARRTAALHGGSWSAIMKQSLLLHCGLLAATVFLGFSLIGRPLLLLLPFSYGVGLGMLSGYFYAADRLAGIGYCLVILYPAALVAGAALLLACRDSWKYSANAYAKAIRGRGEVAQDETKYFLIRQLFYLLLCGGSAVIDAVFGKLFSGFFVR